MRLVKGKGSRSEETWTPLLTTRRELSKLIHHTEKQASEVYTEHHALSALEQYVSGIACRAENSQVLLDVYIAAIKGTKRAGARAVKKDKPGEVYEERASKIEAHEKMCEKVLDMQLQSAEAAPPDCKRRKRSKGQEASSQAGEPSQVASAGNRRKVDVQYYYTLPDTIRTRQQCQSSISAQRFSRRLQALLLPDTVDLDIHNCIFTVMDQLLTRLEPFPPLPEQCRVALHRCAADRDAVCRESLNTSPEKGKTLLVSRLYGAAPPGDLVKNEFVQKLQRVSIYCRWLAIGLLHQEYEYFLSKPVPKKNGYVSAGASVLCCRRLHLAKLG